MYELVIQVSPAGPRAMSLCIEGRATFTTVASRTSMNWPRRTATRPRSRRLDLLDPVIVASFMIIQVACIISKVNTFRLGYTVGVASSRTIPHLTRLMRRVNAKATPELLGVNLKQVAMLAALRDQGELPQTSLCDMMKTTQNTVVTWLNELED